MSKSPVYIGAGSAELSVQAALNLIENSAESASHLLTIADWVALTDGTTVIDRVTGDTNEYSAKEYAQGDSASTGGSAKDYATYVGGGVRGETGDHSAKAWSVGGIGVTDTASKGAAKEWATGTGRIDDQSSGGYSAKEHATGTTVAEGSAKEWAQTTGAPIDTTYSSKEYAQGSVLAAGGSAKNWAQLTTTPTTGTTDASAREWAIGTSTHKGDASSKEYATSAKYDSVEGSAEYSAKHYSAQAEDWASNTTSQVKDDTGVTDQDYSAKEWAAGQLAANTSGSAKQWALGGGNFVEATAVTGSLYSAKRYASLTAQDSIDTNADLLATHQDTLDTAADLLATHQDTLDTAADLLLTNADVLLTHADELLTRADTVLTADDVTTTAANVVIATASEVAARASAAAVSQTYDNFADVYLGSMRTDKTVADAVTLTGASWAKDSSSIAFTGTSSGTVTIGQELTSTGSGYPVGANIIGSQLTTPLVISNPFTVAGTGATLVFAGTGVNGAFNSSTGGPAANNDGDALVSGNLYFNPQSNEMRIWTGAAWIAATAVGQTSLLEYKYVTTSGQVSSKTYSGAADAGGTLSYTQDNIIVFMNGVQLKDTTDYTATNGSSVVLINTPALNDEINIIAFKSFTTADMVSKSAGGAFAAAITWPSGGSVNSNTAHTHSQVAGGDSVHVSTTENTNWDTAYTHSQAAHLALGSSSSTAHRGDQGATAYTDRFKWDGGATGLTAATGRTSLGLSNVDNVADASQTSVGALGTGSITSGFTSIDVGAGTIETTGVITGGTFNGTEIVTPATNNLGIGITALDSITTGNDNVAIGDNALTACTEGSANVAIGDGAHATNIEGTMNVAVGRNALNLATGEQNVAVGQKAGKIVSTGDNNVLIGSYAGDNITSGNLNIIIGMDVQADSATANGQINIGDTIYGDITTGDIWTSTTGKVKQKGAFMQSSTHQALTLGY